MLEFSSHRDRHLWLTHTHTHTILIFEQQSRDHLLWPYCGTIASHSMFQPICIDFKLIFFSLISIMNVQQQQQQKIHTNKGSNISHINALIQLRREKCVHVKKNQFVAIHLPAKYVFLLLPSFVGIYCSKWRWKKNDKQNKKYLSILPCLNRFAFWIFICYCDSIFEEPEAFNVNFLYHWLRFRVPVFVSFGSVYIGVAQIWPKSVQIFEWFIASAI